MIKLRFIKDYAKFVDYDSSNLGAMMQPNKGFEGKPMTFTSKMDEYEDDDDELFNKDDPKGDSPF